MVLYHIGHGPGTCECPGRNGTSPCKADGHGYGHGCDSKLRQHHYHKTRVGVHSRDSEARKLGRETVLKDDNKTYHFPIAYSTSYDGPWKIHNAEIDFNVGSNANPGPWRLRNGTVLVIFNVRNASIAAADHWKGPYRLVASNVCGAGEDPYLYMDLHGSFHCLFHRQPFQQSEVSIGHSFSEDLRHWYQSSVNVAGSVVTFDNNKTVMFGKRERPKLLFDSKGVMTHLITGVAILPECIPNFLNPDNPQHDEDVELAEPDMEKCAPHRQFHGINNNPAPGYLDRSFTLVQEVF